MPKFLMDNDEFKKAVGEMGNKQKKAGLEPLEVKKYKEATELLRWQSDFLTHRERYEQYLEIYNEKYDLYIKDGVEKSSAEFKAGVFAIKESSVKCGVGETQMRRIRRIFEPKS
ncbi:hypothetical protein QSV34_10695 [Porticoccus sp. W117]|uniref:hypothetical protein n=1 Tax=Porticoccus sp. W117 TaxID=3054777 RepID=UPI0025963CAA|nr:hypothetical protein [Porticoccus sp. W117]MDM3871819.1 hypothetical protein [Porticoccus sp. W117]